MTQDIHFMMMAESLAAHSPDRSRKVGCVIVSATGKVVTAGFNDFPKGVRQEESRHERPEKYLWIEHAERNAIYRAARTGVALDGATAYVPWFPCMNCARALVQSGIIALVAYQPDVDDARWGAEFKRATSLLEEAGVAIRLLEKEPSW